ncbi:MAG: oxygenase MpaB family protein [Vicinamibacterales bacterium]
MPVLPDEVTARWSDAVLDAARRRADPPADAAVAALFATGGTDAVRGVMAQFVANDQVVPASLPEPLGRYLETSAVEDPRDAATIAAGERVFAAHGPEILVVLCCSSLPAAYAARKGVQVLHRTAYLSRRPTRRLFETSQMILDVFTPGGLGPAGRGRRTVQKVRLMHAAIRHLIRHDADRPWDVEALGTPINQEDLLGTLMTFSWLVIEGLETLGATLDDEARRAYSAAWMQVGRLMGLEPALLPSTVAETEWVTRAIEWRQVAPSPEGREMTEALLGMMQSNLPPALSSIPSGLVREFLPAEVADFLGVPSYPLERALQDAAEHLVRPFERLFDREAGRHVALRVFAIRWLQAMQAVELGDARASFSVPDSLSDDWASSPAGSEESFWQKLRAWDRARA